MKKLILSFTLFSCLFTPIKQVHAWNEKNTKSTIKTVVGAGAMLFGALGTWYCCSKYKTYKNEKLEILKNG